MNCRAEPLHYELRESPPLAGWRVGKSAVMQVPSRDTEPLGIQFTAFPCGAPNELTLSCKSRPPRGAHCGVVAAATERASEGAKCGRHAAEQFGAARGGSAAGPADRRFLSACEGS